MTPSSKELLYQALETEIGGQKVYEAAIRCAQNDDLKEEWEKYLDETRTHERDPARDVRHASASTRRRRRPGAQVVRHKGEALVQAMEMALRGRRARGRAARRRRVRRRGRDQGPPELGADRRGRRRARGRGRGRRSSEAYDEVEDEEDEHLYHTMGWARELWIESLGMPAVLPPPEEEKEVKTAIGAARAKQSRARRCSRRRRRSDDSRP